MLYRFNLDLAIPESVYNSIPATKKSAFRDAILAIKNYAVKVGDETTVKATCPYCGILNAVVFDETESRCIHSCDVESGGCDKDFAVYFKVEVTAKTAEISQNW